MKEAFWGVLIIMLGLFGIVVINLFQKVTVNNDQVYYVLKESTEASMYDAIDLARYRLTGKVRIVEDKFVENLARRFAQNIGSGNYIVVVQDINEEPPKVSVLVRSGVTSLKGEEFTLSNRIDAIIETKYTKEELLDFLDMSKEEWDNIGKGAENFCDMLIDPTDYDCIPGDIKFNGFEGAKIDDFTCSINSAKSTVENMAKYSVCECGKWAPKEEIVYATGVKEGNNIKYTWNFDKVGELREIHETSIQRTKLDVCTTDIDIMVPKDLTKTEPSTDNSEYVSCGNGIRIPTGAKIVLHGGYTPKNSSNRNLTWTNSNNAALDFTPPSSKIYISKESFSKATIEAKEVQKEETKESNVTATTTLNQTATCKVTVWDGSVDSVSCENITLNVGQITTLKANYEPYNATKIKFNFAIKNMNLVKDFDSSTGKFQTENQGSTEYTVTSENGKTATCKLVINKYVPIYEDSSSLSSGTWKVTINGETTCYFNKNDALNATKGQYGDITISRESNGVESLYASGRGYGSAQGAAVALTTVDGKRIDYNTRSGEFTGSAIEAEKTAQSSGRTVSGNYSWGNDMASDSWWNAVGRWVPWPAYGGW